MEEVGHCLPRLSYHVVRLLAGAEKAALVAATLAQIASYGTYYALGNLRTAGAIEEDGRLPIHVLLQCWKLVTQRRGIKEG
jgi:hypothetical protein